MPTKLCGSPDPRCQTVLPDSAYSIDDVEDSDAETPEPCFDLDFDDSESDVDAYSEPEDD